MNPETLTTLRRIAREILAERIAIHASPLPLPRCTEHGALISTGYPGVLLCRRMGCEQTWPPLSSREQRP